jgi:hypothetical protein
MVRKKAERQAKGKEAIRHVRERIRQRLPYPDVFSTDRPFRIN